MNGVAWDDSEPNEVAGAARHSARAPRAVKRTNARRAAFPSASRGSKDDGPQGRQGHAAGRGPRQPQRQQLPPPDRERIAAATEPGDRLQRPNQGPGPADPEGSLAPRLL